MEAFLAASGTVLLAELGDKSQLLAMGFATRYSWRTVIFGVGLATALLQLLAVTLGVFLGTLIRPEMMLLISSLAFVCFGVWSLTNGDEDEDSESEGRYSPFWNVFLAFFIAEFGDKTQFAAVTLAAKYHEFFFVFIGALLGMIIANFIGIAIGVCLHKTLPQKYIKFGAASIFLGYGILGIIKAFG